MTLVSRLRSALAIIAFVTTASATYAQDTERAAILATVQRLFDGMRTRDSARIMSAFDPSSSLVESDTSATLKWVPVTGFAGSMAHRTGPVVTERIFDPQVRIDGSIAQVWAYFTVHLDTTLARCGTDAFTLMKVGAQWRITNTTFIRHAAGCAAGQQRR